MHENENNTHEDKDPNPRNKYNLAPETARVGYKYGKLHPGRYTTHVSEFPINTIIAWIINDYHEQ